MTRPAVQLRKITVAAKTGKAAEGVAGVRDQIEHYCHPSSRCKVQVACRKWQSWDDARRLRAEGESPDACQVHRHGRSAPWSSLRCCPEIVQPGKVVRIQTMVANRNSALPWQGRSAVSDLGFLCTVERSAPSFLSGSLVCVSPGSTSGALPTWEVPAAVNLRGSSVQRLHTAHSLPRFSQPPSSERLVMTGHPDLSQRSLHVGSWASRACPGADGSPPPRAGN